MVFGDAVTVSGCWFHYADCGQALIKRLDLTDAYNNDDTTHLRSVSMPVVLTAASCSGHPADVPGSKSFDDGGLDVKDSTRAALPLR